MRVIDLSQHVIPGQSKRVVGTLPFFAPHTGDWRTILTMDSHVGTHAEFPRHIGIERDSLHIPIERFVCRGVIMRFRAWHAVALVGDMIRAHSLCNEIRRGDFIILDSDDRSEPFVEQPRDDRLRLTVGAAEELASRGVSGVGLGSGVAIEWSVEESLRIHHVLLSRDIYIVEVLRNLDAITQDKFLWVCLPLPVAGMDSCCVRAVAIEGVSV